ncbi:hypothetical protein E2P81_ATG05364 [Venturia nashicola]|nr:hypothetical protein E2P81_ATG05364 [Venturia nashicola]
MDKKDYPKIEIETLANRSSSLTLLLQLARSSCPALQSADVAILEPSVAGANVATGTNLVVGIWKKEDRILPPSQAVTKKSGFEGGCQEDC